MDKTAIKLDKKIVFEIINYMHTSLKKYGIADNRIALFGSFLNGNTHIDSDIDMIVISDLFEGKNLFERIEMTLKAELEVRNRYLAPMDILLKTPQEYNYSKEAYFNSEIIV